MKPYSALFLAATAGTLFAQEPLTSLIPKQTDPDTALVLSLLGENLGKRTFSFATVVTACSGKKVMPLTNEPAHQRVTGAIAKALALTITELNQPDSPAHQIPRINEVSKFFEDGIHKHLNEIDGFKCDVPATRAGEHQHVGYPDLRVLDEESKQVFYLDPKLVEKGSLDSTFRTFYFEPKNETLKITEDAVHLLVGIEHDGKDGEWTFSGWRLVDLSKLKVRLKAEFQASNADVYQKSELQTPPPPPEPPPAEKPPEEKPPEEKPPTENPPAEAPPVITPLPVIPPVTPTEVTPPVTPPVVAPAVTPDPEPQSAPPPAAKPPETELPTPDQPR
jgi:hypothetical protein